MVAGCKGYSHLAVEQDEREYCSVAADIVLVARALSIGHIRMPGVESDKEPVDRKTPADVKDRRQYLTVPQSCAVAVRSCHTRCPRGQMTWVQKGLVDLDCSRDLKTLACLSLLYAGSLDWRVDHAQSWHRIGLKTIPRGYKPPAELGLSSHQTTDLLRNIHNCYLDPVLSLARSVKREPGSYRSSMMTAKKARG